MRPMHGMMVLLWIVTIGIPASAGDWPMWRHDVERSGSTSEELPAELHLQWTRELPEPQPAWPESQYKLQFDASYMPVVANDRMFVGSTVHDTIAAYATDTGEELWRFYTEGPVRFAPAVWEQKVYTCSDDGSLYCLSAETGELVWKFDGGPQRRPIIGNGRLISMWPARGGVVVDDGVAYFASGLWPSMGIFVHAVDANTGKRIWINSDTSSRFVTHPHGADSFGSISPQGALSLSGENLIVPGGRTLPGVFDRATGELKHFDFGGKGSGGHDVVVAGPFHFVQNQVFRTEDGAEIGPMFATLVADGQIIGNEAAGKSIVFTSVAGESKDVEFTDRRGNKITRSSFVPTSTRRFAPAAPGRVMMQAGQTIFTADGGNLAAYDLPRALESDGEVPPIWTAAFDGNVASLLAANGRLIVVTDDSTIHCLGAEKADPKHYSYQPAELTASTEKAAVESAAELLQLAPIAGGYAVSLDAAEPELLMELVRQSELEIVAVDAVQERIDAIRDLADETGVYGKRLSAHVRPPFDFNFPPYLADLVVSTEGGFQTSREIAAIFAMLRPYGGAACLRLDDAQHDDLLSAVADAQLERAEVERNGGWTVIRRVGALPGSGDWTHQYGNAANSVVSQDTLVKAPMGVLWFGGPSNDKVLPRHGHGPAPQVVGGRLFIEGPDMLRCVDVYTGRVWWERDLPGIGAFYDNTSHQPGAGEIGSNYVSLEDHLYVIYGKELLELDAQTGETTRTFSIPAEAGTRIQPHWGSLLVSGDVLVVTADPTKVKGMEYSTTPSFPKGSKVLIKPHADWRIFAGSDPADDWNRLNFDDSKWRTAEAGFGINDGDDRTVLEGMRGKYARVYARYSFDGSEAADAAAMTMMLNFDDAFVAYLNGEEVARVNIGSGSGATAKITDSHEAEGYQPIEIKNFRKLLKPGNNVLAIEGHNAGVDSSDFSLDPYLLVTPPSEKDEAPSLAEYIEPARYASSSRELVAFDRHTGSVLWSRPADFSYRHNAVCLSDDTAYAIDGMSMDALALLRRRGVSTAASPQLLAIDLHTGDVNWSTDQDVFGTFLNYSAEYDVLLQGGSAYRDRAKDEVGEGLIAYRGESGEVLWAQRDLKYGGPCLLLRDRIITNGLGGFELNLLTGESTGWDYSRMYGCNTAIGCQTMLTFRSGAAGFYDLANNSGTGNFSGFKSSCTSNLIPANGLLNAPDYTRTCSCAYQLQTSLAFVHMKEGDSWTFNPADSVQLPLNAVGLNLGAPGDRRDENGIFWFDYPVIGGPSPELSVTTEPAEPDWFLRHTSLITAADDAWIAGSGGEDLRSITWDLSGLVTPGTYRVQLVFAEPANMAGDGGDVTVAVQGAPPITVTSADVRTNGVVIKEIAGVSVDGALSVTLTPTADAEAGPKLCGVAVVAE